VNKKTVVLAPAQSFEIGLERLPPVIAAAGQRARQRFIEFFVANIRNRNTRLAYARAAGQFFAWCERHELGLTELQPVPAKLAGVDDRLQIGRDADRRLRENALLGRCWRARVSVLHRA
jgi:hypothetical protein